MAVLLFIQICTSFLFVLSLQPAEISALQCYGCFMDPNVPPERAQDDCHLDSPPDEYLVNTYSSLPRLQQSAEEFLKVMITRRIKMASGSFCVKVLPRDGSRRFVLRYILPEAPEAKYLDESGCLVNDMALICFCNQDKCNNEH